MLCDEPIIDEEIEALLYAQVYYGKQEDTEEPNLTQSSTDPKPDGKEADTVEKASDTTNPYKFLIQKYQYFEHNIDKEEPKTDSNKDIFIAETSKTLSEENKNSETDNPSSRLESNIFTDHIDKTVQEKTLPIQTFSLAERTESPQQFIEISTSISTTPTKNNSTQVLTNAPSPINQSENQLHQPTTLHNNITINQYLFPPTFVERLKSSVENRPLSKRCQQDLRRLKKGSITEHEFFNNLKRRLKVQKKQQQTIRKILKSKQAKAASSEIISLSDSDNSDIEFVGVTIKMDSGNKELIDDDEIIYIAPPPVPVINVDSESDSESFNNPEKSPEKSFLSPTLQDSENTITPEKSSGSQICLDEDEASNDFLQSQNTSDNFNFSLHGSDFQETEFVRPANPTDAYETESSTSTSDFNRDSSRQFCNTVKTIVFSEVDFPQQDMFADNNLESFGEFITPKRKDNKKNSEVTECSADTLKVSKGNKRINPRTSSESSSESEYGDTNTHQNLPELTPMVCAENSPKKGSSKKKQVGSPKKKKSKFSGGNDGILDVDESHNRVDEPIRKRKSCESDDIDGQAAKKKSKKKKNKSDVKNSKDNEEEVNNPEVLDDSKKKSKKKKKQGNIQPQNLDESEEVVNDSNKKKAKKKKSKEAAEKSFENENEVDNRGQGTEEANEQNILEKGGNKKNKKRKQKESLEGKLEMDKSANIIDENQVSSTTEKVNESENTNQDILADQRTGNESEDTNSRKKGKKKKRVSSDKRSSVDEASFSNNEKDAEKDKETSLAVQNLEGCGDKEVEGNKNGNEHESDMLEKDSVTENNRKKNKRKKQLSTDRQISGDQLNKSSEENQNEKNVEEDVSKSVQESSSKKTLEVQTKYDDIILIEQAIPVHTIESSDSDDDDILSLENVGKDLELANISVIKETVDVNEEETSREFDIDHIQSKMSDDPDKWKITPADRYNLKTPHRGPRCNKCRQLGHISISCPNKPSDPSCALCGMPGHQEPRCPNKVCFSCGQPGNYSTVFCYKCAKDRNDRCDLCYLTGHKSDYCPDLWRRYFLTTTAGPIQGPKKSPMLKPRNKQWCSGCASSGHLEYECNTYKWMREYPVSSPNIFKYHNVYPVTKKQRENNKTPIKQRPVVSVGTPKQHIRYSVDSPSTSGTVTTPQNNNVNSGEILEQTHVVNDPQADLPSAANIQECQSALQPLGTEGENKQTADSVPNPAQTLTDIQENETSEANTESPSPNEVQQAQPERFRASPQTSSKNKKKALQAKRQRAKERKKAIRNSRINPLSMMRQPMTYAPYQSVYNPYSLGQVPPSRELFNPVPFAILNQQLNNYAGRFPIHENDGGFFNQNPQNFYISPQFNPQIQLNPQPLMGPPRDAYQQFSGQFNPEPYYNFQEPGNVYAGENFSGLPYTITTKPSEVNEGFYVNKTRYNLRDREALARKREEALAREREVWENELAAWGREYAANFTATRDSDEHREVFAKGKFDGPGDLRQDLNNSRNTSRDCIKFDGPGDLRQDLNNSRNTSRDCISWETRGEPQKSYSEQFHHVESNSFHNKNASRQQTSTSKNSSINPLQIESTVLQRSNHTIPPARKSRTSYPKCRHTFVDDDTSEKFKTLDGKVLQKFIRVELTKLKSLKKSDARPFKQRLYAIDRANKREVKNRSSANNVMYLLYKKINMFLFGVHKIGGGKHNLDYLKNFAYNSNQIKLSPKERKKLFFSYKYIFGGEHRNYNYMHNLNALTVNRKK